MAAAIALAVVLVIAVAGMSLAMQAQRPPLQTTRTRPPRTARNPVPGRVRRVRDRPTPPPSPPVAVPDPMPVVESKGPELLRSGIPAQAKVIGVVDERVVGPVTRSRLTLEIRPEGAEPFEVTIRHAFQTAEVRARVKVGGQIAVRYDKDEHRKVVIDPEGN